MKKEEAIKLMQDGHKLTHQYFGPEEWVTIQNGKYLLEDGVTCTAEEFWRERTILGFDEDWEFWIDQDSDCVIHQLIKDGKEYFYGFIQGETGIVAEGETRELVRKKLFALLSAKKQLDEYLKSPRAGIVVFPSESNWISIKERLPDVGLDPEYPMTSATVLVFVNGEVLPAYFEEGKWIDYKYDDAFDDESAAEIDCWMPLPMNPSATYLDAKSVHRTIHDIAIIEGLQAALEKIGNSLREALLKSPVDSRDEFIHVAKYVDETLVNLKEAKSNTGK